MIRLRELKDCTALHAPTGNPLELAGIAIAYWRLTVRTKGAAMKKIENGSEWIDSYVERKGANLKGVAQGLRQLVMKTVAGAKETVNPWKIPTFESNGPMCYFAIAANHLTFGFLRGTSLPDPQRLLEGTGKSLRHVKLRTLEDLRQPALKKLIQAAARLNKKEPMEGMKPKKKAK
jgi:hypothetical protein